MLEFLEVERRDFLPAIDITVKGERIFFVRRRVAG